MIASVIIEFLLGAGLLLHLPGINVRVAVADCGEQNAFYQPDAKLIVLCNELGVESAGVVRFTAAHELGHAVVHQYGLPVIGSEEVAADEFAMLALIDSGHTGDLVSAAIWFASDGNQENPYDDHSSSVRRAALAVCFAVGAVRPDTICGQRVLAAQRSWARVLLAFGPAGVVSP